MADISTQEDKEFEALHPNLKQLYTGGFDLNPKTVNMINQGNALGYGFWGSWSSFM